MNTEQFHQQTILGLLQTTVNRTHLDLERRQLINLGSVVNWTNLRTLTNEINSLFTREIDSRRERVAFDNIIVEIRLRATSTYEGLADTAAFEANLRQGIVAYSQHIRRENLTPPENFAGFQQTLEEQFKWGILHLHEKRYRRNPRLKRYSEYTQRIRAITRQFFLDNRANLVFSNDFLAAQQNCCWCLFNYRKFPLYRTVLRDFIENIYIKASEGLLRQGLDIPLTELRRELEKYISEQCTYLHFNLEQNSAHKLSAVFRGHRVREQLREQQLNMALTNAQLRTVLVDVLGQHGLNINQTYQNLTQAIQNMPGPVNAPARELSIVKIADFSGKDDEDPHEWMDSFERAAAANQWVQDARQLAIVTGYMKDAAAAWATAAMAAGANNQITGFSGNNAATDFKDHFLEKFTPDSKQNKWYYELSTIRQRAEESVDEYSLRF